MPHEHGHDAPETVDPAPRPDGRAAPRPDGPSPAEPSDGRNPDEQPAVAGTPVVVRRNAGLAALVGAAASAVAIAYLARAVHTSAPMDWLLFGLMAVVGGHHLAALVDARTPLLVADDLGVRVRLGRDWRGLPWEAVGHVVVHPRRGLLRDGRLVFAPHSLARALDGLDAQGRRQVALNQRMYGAPLAVPLGSTTRLSGVARESLVAGLQALTLGRTAVVQLDPRTLEVVEGDGEAGAGLGGQASRRDAGDASSGDSHRDTPAEAGRAGSSGQAPSPAPGGTEDPAGPAVPTSTTSTPTRRSMLGGIGTIVSRVAKGRAHDVDAAAPGGGADPAAQPAVEPAGPPVALRASRPALRAETTVNLPTVGGNALDPSAEPAGVPEGRELRRPGSVDLVIEPVPTQGRVRPISTMGDAVAPLVIDDFVTEPAYDPVIGPELSAARTRLGMTVDELAERTRIRPHVIESIEVDDFTPCGGDFYARGHLRTLAQILGKDPAPLLASFEKRYATAPVNARRVFEAELATGTTGSMRATLGGPNWSLLVGAVLALLLVWGVVRLFSAAPAELEVPAPVVNGSAGIAGSGSLPTAPSPVEPVTVLLTATAADSDVVVRDGDGTVVYSGKVAPGERTRLRVTAPVRVRAADGGAVSVRVGGRDRGVLGPAGEPARRTFG